MEYTFPPKLVLVTVLPEQQTPNKHRDLTLMRVKDRMGMGEGMQVHACAETKGKYQVCCSIILGLHVLAGPQAAGSRLKFSCL